MCEHFEHCMVAQKGQQNVKVVTEQKPQNNLYLKRGFAKTEFMLA